MDERRLAAVLVDFARTLTADFSIQTTLDHLARSVIEVLPVTGAGVLLMPTEHDHHFAAATDDVILQIESLQLDLGEGPCLAAYHTGERVAVPNLVEDTVFPLFSPQAAKAGLGAVFSFPLRLDHHRIGALELYCQPAMDLAEEDLEGAQVLADVIAAYVLNARARSTAQNSIRLLEAKALHDPLTGLPNRVLLTDRLTQALRRSARRQGFAAVMFLDVDGLKGVNDAHGHHAGDLLLQQMTRRMQSELRPGDTLARLAGDEFVVVCEDLMLRAQAEEVADRILAAFDEPFHLDGVILHSSVSIGMTFARQGTVTAERALATADAAMYHAKSLGGGRWSTTGPSPRPQRAAGRDPLSRVAASDR